MLKAGNRRDKRITRMLKAGNGTATALASSFQDKIRPLLDAVDRLRHLKVTLEGIDLPTIVVVGDQSSGKSSVLESLAGISLPRGQGICTRVPLIMRLQNDATLVEPKLHLEFLDKVVPTTEEGVTVAINNATDEIAGKGKNISDTPVTLVVMKKGVPDLTMVDLPGITRVSVHSQPENIYEQISNIIMKYISPKESIILNVLSAAVDFPTCESIRMSQKVDKSGERTLAVVTKPDKAPEGLLEKVTADDVNIGLGYVCVRNRINNESYEEARAAEKNLFDTHPLLSKIDKSIVGVPVLAKKLMHIQAVSIARCLPDIVKKINVKLSSSVNELNSMPQNLSSVSDAMRALMRIISLSKESLKKVLILGDFEEFPDELDMHGTARLADMLTDYSKQFPSKFPCSGQFLIDEIGVLQEAKAIVLPNFLPHNAFLSLLKRKLNLISDIPQSFVDKLWDYVEILMSRILLKHCDNFPQLQSSTRAAIEALLVKMKGRSHNAVKEIIEMEINVDYTCNPDFLNTWHDLMSKHQLFLETVNDPQKPSKIDLGRFGYVDVEHLRQHSELVEQAFDMRMRLTAYWKCVITRLVDSLALHVLYSIKCLVENEIESELINELVGRKQSGLERLLEESPSSAGKRQRLKKSIGLLNESKVIVSKIMDRIAAADD